MASCPVRKLLTLGVAWMAVPSVRSTLSCKAPWPRLIKPSKCQIQRKRKCVVRTRSTNLLTAWTTSKLQTLVDSTTLRKTRVQPSSSLAKEMPIIRPSKTSRRLVDRDLSGAASSQPQHSSTSLSRRSPPLRRESTATDLSSRTTRCLRSS